VKRPARIVAALVGALALATFAGSFEMLPAALRTVAVGVAILQVPGWLVVRALRLSVSPAELPGACFAFSLGACVPAALTPLALAQPLDMFLPILAVVVSALAALALGGLHLEPTEPPRLARAPEEPSDRYVPALRIVAALLCVALAFGAWQLTRTGAVDRWWYLAYVREYMMTPRLDVLEPFLGSGFVHPRFAANAWLVVFAAWAKLAAVDPVFLYERLAPPLLVSVGLSASLFLASSVFSRRVDAWLAVIATALLWAGGSLVPMLTRSVEDKILATVTLLPVLVGSGVHALRSRHPAWLLASVVAAAAASTVHPLIYFFAVALLAPYALVMTVARLTRPAVCGALLAVLLAGAAYPLGSGLQARAMYADDGASLSEPDHPVVRIHRNRGRLVDLGGGDHVVDPRLLLHPIAVFGLLSLFATGGLGRDQRFFLLPATILPLFVCFVPPLVALAGKIAVPWMTYRILWIVPYAMLAAVGMRRLSERFGWRPVFVALLASACAVPSTMAALGERSREERLELAFPARRMAPLVASLRSLDETALIAAPPELGERIPALAGARVLSMSDRATTVFSGSRARARARLRANAAISAGLWRAGTAPTPTHLITAPGQTAMRYCGAKIHASERTVLCEFVAAPPTAGTALARTTAAGGMRRYDYAALVGGAAGPYSLICDPPALQQGERLIWERPGPWSARRPGLACRLVVARATPRDDELPAVVDTLVLTPLVGTASEELLIRVRGADSGGTRWSAHARVTVANGQPLSFGLPAIPVSTLELQVVPVNLPFVKLTRFELGFGAREKR
jgi:hypothetical protein